MENKTKTDILPVQTINISKEKPNNTVESKNVWTVWMSFKKSVVKLIST